MPEFFKRKKQKEHAKQRLIISSGMGAVIEYKPLKREVVHTKAIVDGKLYDTKTAENMGWFGNERVLFRTTKGNYFTCLISYDHYETGGYRINEIAYHDIEPETEENAKAAIGKYNVEKYIELFGEPEQA